MGDHRKRKQNHAQTQNNGKKNWVIKLVPFHTTAQWTKYCRKVPSLWLFCSPTHWSQLSEYYKWWRQLKWITHHRILEVAILSTNCAVKCYILWKYLGSQQEVEDNKSNFVAELCYQPWTHDEIRKRLSNVSPNRIAYNCQYDMFILKISVQFIHKYTSQKLRFKSVIKKSPLSASFS